MILEVTLRDGTVRSGKYDLFEMMGQLRNLREQVERGEVVEWDLH